MKKRLRKKLHRGEFRELGFEVRFRCTDDISDKAFDATIDAFILQAIEACGLVCGGGGQKPSWCVFVALNRRGSVTEEHRVAVQRWLATQPSVTEFQAGPLVDVWYPPA
ncbi:MAG: YggL family protein [Proteobacteria bacterium]|nr:YggL family protein [Pseudomonadota bacterium]